MKHAYQLLLALFSLVTISFSFFASPAQAQYCAASGSCPASGTIYSCQGGEMAGEDCGDISDCPGSDCRPYAFCDTGNASSPSCGSYPSCGGGCPSGTCNLGSCSAVGPPPPVNPPPVNPPPVNPPPDPDPGDPPPDPDPGDPPPPDEPTYVCVPCSGCFESAYGNGDSLAACSASCTCDTGPPPDVTDPNAGESQCQEYMDETTVRETIDPGETSTWETWAPPAGNTPEERLNGNSPGRITQSLTSPADKVTYAVAFQENGCNIISIYLMNEDSDTWYFYNGDNEAPLVIFTRSDYVLEKAKSIGYVQLDPGIGVTEAQAYPKRIFKVDTDEKWSNTYNRHIPRGVGLIPYINCASNIGADDQNYFRISDELIQETPICNPRGTHPIRVNDGDLHDTGGYLGLENDFTITDAFNPIGPNLFTQPDQRYMDDIEWVLMPRLHGGQMRWHNGFMRQAVFQVPIHTLLPDSDNDMYGYVTNTCEYDNSKNIFAPIRDNGESDACFWQQGGYNFTPVLPSSTPAACTNITVKDTTTDTFVTDNTLRTGRTYELSTVAHSERYGHGFINQGFDYNTGYPVLGWNQAGLSVMEIVTCASAGISCASSSSASDQWMLRIAKNPAVSEVSAGAYTDYFETEGSLSGKTIAVEFEARAQSGTHTISAVRLRRFPHTPVSDTAPYVSEGDIDANGATVYFKQPDGTLSQSITINSSSWQRFTGVATFPESHPSNSDTSKLRIAIRPPGDNAVAYLDNFSVFTTKQPSVKFVLRPSATQCSATGQFTFDATPNAAGDTFTANVTLPNTATNGTYTVYSELATGFGGGCSGNPQYTPSNTCDLVSDVDPQITANCSSTCSKQMTVQLCVSDKPQKPAFVDHEDPNGWDVNIVEGTMNQIRYHSNGFKMVARPTGTAAQQAAVTRMVMTVTQRGETTPSTTVTGVKVGSNWEFSYTATKANSNEVTVSIIAYNDIDCTSPGNVSSSTALRADIRMLSYEQGHLLEVPRNMLSTYSCNETYNSLTLSGQNDRIMRDISTTFPGIDMIVTTDGTTKSTYSGLAEDLLLAYSDSVMMAYPHNPDNTSLPNGWGNRATAQLRLPLQAEEESYICVPRCHAQTDTATYMGCTIAAEDIPKNAEGFDNLTVYLTKANLYYDSWWQARGGLVFANGAINSPLPIFPSTGLPSVYCNQALDLCQPYLSGRMTGTFLSSENDLLKSAGIPFTNASIDTTNGKGGFITQRSSQQFADSAGAVTSTQNYTYFSNLVDWNDPDVNSITAASINAYPVVAASKIYETEDNGQRVYIFRKVGDLTIDLTADWDIPATHKVMIFVTGNLTIDGPTDDASKMILRQGDLAAGQNWGSFLGFFAGQDIIFTSDTGYTNEATYNPILAGVFLAQRDLIIQSKAPGSDEPGDLKFVAEGSFIAHRKIVLERQFDDSADVFSREKNARSPIDMFIFRPDLVMNVPDLIKQPDISWREAN